MKVFSKLHSERYESVCHSVLLWKTSGAFTVNVAFQKAFKCVYKATVRQAVARKEKKKIMQRASPGLICSYFIFQILMIGLIINMYKPVWEVKKQQWRLGDSGERLLQSAGFITLWIQLYESVHVMNH